MKETKEVTIYNEIQRKKDEEKFNRSIANNEKIDWTSFQRLVYSDLIKNDVIDTNSFSMCGIRIEDIERALENPKTGFGKLMQISNYLMHKSPHYYRLNMQLANMAMFNWWLDIYDVKDNVNVATLRKVYDSVCAKFESMNIKHEFSKIMKVLIYQDVYFGLVIENNNDFFFQQIDYRMCKLKKISDGLYNFAIDLAMINPINIGAYPTYVKKAYIDFKEGKGSNIYIPPSDKQICLKLNSQWIYPYPILISLVKDIFDLDLYKRLNLQSARTDNYKAITVSIPIDKDVVDKPLLTPDTLGIFAEINRESLSDDIGMLYTLGSDGKMINFKDSNNTRNRVADAIDTIYDSSGITKELYNGSSSGNAVSMSIENDAGFIYGIYRQIERWMNRYIKLNKYNKSTFKISFSLLNMTIFNKDNVISRYKDACTFGVPVKSQYMSALNLTPSKVKGAFIAEQLLFDYQNNMIPMSSSYTQSSDGGRPTNEEKGLGLSESGEVTQNLESNVRR